MATPATADSPMSFSSYLLTPVPTVKQQRPKATAVRPSRVQAQPSERVRPRYSSAGDDASVVRGRVGDRSPSRHSTVSRGTRGTAGSGRTYGGIGSQSLHVQRARVQQLTRQVRRERGLVVLAVAVAVLASRGGGLGGGVEHMVSR